MHTSFVLFSRGYRIEDTEQRNRLSGDKGRTGTVGVGVSWFMFSAPSQKLGVDQTGLSLPWEQRPWPLCADSMYRFFVFCDRGVKDDLAVLAKVGFKVRVDFGKGD